MSDKLETGKKCLNAKVFVADHGAAAAAATVAVVVVVVVVDDNDDDDDNIGRFHYISFYFLLFVYF
jgi:hypothetical protein